ncbi:MAG: L-threonylcarbamoyladenylate synthase [Zestosphaera sp.]
MKTKVVKVDPLRPDHGVIAEAAEVLRNGGLVAFPTETVYGLGADAYNANAVRRIFAVKERPPDNPLILHIGDPGDLDLVAKDVPQIAYEVVGKVWPGPVTLVLKRNETVPPEVTAGLPTVAVRCPAHPTALSLIKTLGNPIAAPSANLSGRPSPTSARHVIKDMSGRVELIIDGGDTFLGVESTILNLMSDPPTLLRPGPVGVDVLERLMGVRVIVPSFAKGIMEAEKALSPGLKYRHYSPETPLTLADLGQCYDTDSYVGCVKAVVEEYLRAGLKVIVICSSETCRHYARVTTLELGSRQNLYEVARNLFKTLREVDEVSADIAVVEGFEERGIGLAIMNRLRKASSRVLSC